MSKHNEKPIKSFEITYLGDWYYVEIMSEKKVEVYTETPDNVVESKIENLVNYLRSEGFLSKEYLDTKL